jgi:electron transfer flavoprotein alpha subunit
MSVLIFIDHSDGTIKKNSLEALSYGSSLAASLGVEAAGLLLGTVKEDLGSLGRFGVKKVYQVGDASLDQLDAQVYSKTIAQAKEQTGATVIVMSNNITGRSTAPLVAAKLKAGLVSGAVSLPDLSNGFVVKKNVFSGKAFAHIAIKTDIKVIAISPNSYTINTGDGVAEVVPLDIAIPERKVKVTATSKITGTVPLSEAELVVSGGRGLKGPENWGMVEELAGLIGAATACSRAVADAHWRPHHEHVGQTGLAITPNLYIAIGISGAIQHLAGVNRSKVIVVINKDPEAPFFKAADYGIVGDAFEVVPRFIEEVKKLKNA